MNQVPPPQRAFPLNTSDQALAMLLSGSAHCYPWIDSVIGTAGTASATFDACNLDSLTLVTNAAMSGNAAADNQHTLYQTLCGNGELIVKVDQITATSGYAGLFVREYGPRRPKSSPDDPKRQRCIQTIARYDQSIPATGAIYGSGPRLVEADSHRK